MNNESTHLRSQSLSNSLRRLPLLGDLQLSLSNSPLQRRSIHLQSLQRLHNLSSSRRQSVASLSGNLDDQQSSVRVRSDEGRSLSSLSNDIGSVLERRRRRPLEGGGEGSEEVREDEVFGFRGGVDGVGDDERRLDLGKVVKIQRDPLLSSKEDLGLLQPWFSSLPIELVLIESLSQDVLDEVLEPLLRESGSDDSNLSLESGSPEFTNVEDTDGLVLGGVEGGSESGSEGELVSFLEGLDGGEVVGGEGLEGDIVDGGFVKFVVEVSGGEGGGEEFEDGFPLGRERERERNREEKESGAGLERVEAGEGEAGEEGEEGRNRETELTRLP